MKTRVERISSLTDPGELIKVQFIVSTGSLGPSDKNRHIKRGKPMTMMSGYNATLGGRTTLLVVAQKGGGGKTASASAYTR